MQIRCSYCRAIYGEKEPLGDPSVTHGICQDCLAYYEPQWQDQGLDEFLERYEYPVLAADAEGRIVAANQAMSKLLNKPVEQFRHQLGGEATECVYARLPEGCGKTVHCQRCAIRMAVESTRATGKPLHRIPASLALEDARVRFLISTFLEGEVVHLVVEEVVGSEPRASAGPHR